MAKSKLKVGDRVAALLDQDGEVVNYIHPNVDPNAGPAYGEIVSIESKLIKVKWDNADYFNDLEFVSSQLKLEADFNIHLSVLEKEFKNLEDQIKVKLKEAAASIGEANKLAKKAGLDLVDIDSVYSTLYPALDKAGWRTSSFGC